ncbi:XRE family transcriptional regulator [Aerococcus agrisoli]|uniref:XRE family transcriptional regulator n=1 Tax=Aerococcus agrisoli TaxID=2487350 RepID=A0A3N4GVZ4_9LACT|nr:helix-turn-helix transcriptional regulator [Aerococcus agrisoli]RPA65068.1 XRE family transcriptional regulator [Aerococcus agrisoli]
MLLDRVKELSKKRDMRVADLEDALGFGRNTIYQWNKRTPGSDKLEKVAEYFNVSTDYLLGRTDNPKVNTDDTLLAAHIEDDITEEEMEEIKQFIEFIKSKR